MTIDPILELTEDIRATDGRMVAACKQNETCYSHGRAEEINILLTRLKSLYAELFETLPTSALGAGELLRIVVERLPPRDGRYGAHLSAIADRLGAGMRLHGDLVWLRALADVFLGGPPPERNARLGLLVSHAIHGAAQPVLIFRAAWPSSHPVTDRRELAMGPR